MDATILIGILIGLLQAWFWYDKNRTDKLTDKTNESNATRFSNMGKELSSVSNKQTEHDNKFVTDQRVRDIVKDEVEPLRVEVNKMSANVDRIMTVLTELTIEIRVSNSKRDGEN